MNGITLSVLMILTSSAHMGDSKGGHGEPTGLWAEELATPCNVLADAGVKATLALPAGGAAPVDPGRVKPAGQNPQSSHRVAEHLLQALGR